MALEDYSIGDFSYSQDYSGDLGGGYISDTYTSGLPGTFDSGIDLGGDTYYASDAYGGATQQTMPNGSSGWFDRNGKYIGEGINAALAARNIAKGNHGLDAAAQGYLMRTNPFLQTAYGINQQIDPTQLTSLIDELAKSRDIRMMSDATGDLARKLDPLIDDYSGQMQQYRNAMTNWGGDQYRVGQWLQDRGIETGQKSQSILDKGLGIVDYGRGLQDYLTAGTLPPAMQAQLDQANAANRSNLLASYGVSGAGGLVGGMPSSTGLAADIAGLNTRSMADKAALEQQLAELGLQNMTAGTGIGQLGISEGQLGMGMVGTGTGMVSEAGQLQQLLANIESERLRGITSGRTAQSGIYGQAATMLQTEQQARQQAIDDILKMQQQSSQTGQSLASDVLKAQTPQQTAQSSGGGGGSSGGGGGSGFNPMSLIGPAMGLAAAFI